MSHVRWIQTDRISVRDDRPIAARSALRFHRAFDPPLELKRLDPRSEEAGGGPLDESLDESLDGGEWSHGAPGV